MAGTDGKAPIIECVRAGWGFMGGSISVVAPAAVLAAVFNTVAQVMLDEKISPNVGLGWVMFAISLAVTISYTAFLYRLMLHEDASGFFGLKFGRNELNLAGVSIAVAFLFVIIGVIVGILAVIVLVIIAGATGVDLSQLEGDPEASAAAIQRLVLSPPALAIWTLIVALMLYVGARLALIGPATIGERRMMAFTTWRWTQGNGVRIAAALLLGVIPIIVVVLAVAFLFAGLVGSITGDVNAVIEPTPGHLLPHALFQFVISTGQFVFAAPVQAGIASYLYRGLRPPELPQP